MFKNLGTFLKGKKLLLSGFCNTGTNGYRPALREKQRLDPILSQILTEHIDMKGLRKQLEPV
jgi:hypothetical protein